MPELRKDPVIGRWVIISTERGKRPSSFQSVSKRGPARLCPFCPGAESNTPREILAYRDPGTEPNKPGWSLRIFPNKYPALVIEGNLTREPHGVYDKMQGIGAHEVIVETADHARDMDGMSEKKLHDVFWAYRERMIDLERDRRFRYILVFKNHGQAAGASLEHSHSQLIATPIVPKKVQEEIEGSRRYYEFKERCVFCDIVRQEIMDQERIVTDFDSFITMQPFAARFPFETWLLPKTHQSSYLEMSDSDFWILARTFKDILTRLKVALNDPPFNFVLHTRPMSPEHHTYYHWHFEIIPKLTRVAGFEWGSGFYINPTTPEQAAAYLRQIDVTAPPAAAPSEISEKEV
ncbi:MAG TPA: galactose-1-phosphate uridylyltransferase [candidate division Zixibacteria bacterium]|nr:galactose-1-phosphate uridylyltransferase [candidate division Zixibacteria bacterium]